MSSNGARFDNKDEIESFISESEPEPEPPQSQPKAPGQEPQTPESQLQPQHQEQLQLQLLSQPQPTFNPITSVEDFFNNGLPIFGSDHPLKQSPCRPIIGTRSDEIPGDIIDNDGNVVGESSYSNIVYYCKLHPDLGSVFLKEIEFHCREKEPELHKAEILAITKEEEKESGDVNE